MEYPKSSAWSSKWIWPEDSPWKVPPKGADFRDYLPPTIDEVQEAYRPFVREGEWTVGLCDFWAKRTYFVMHAVHEPCWCSFRWNPCKWRGTCFGRGCEACDFAGWYMMRWARTAHASSAGPQYTCAYKGRCQDGVKPVYHKLCAPCHYLCVPDTQRQRRICCLGLVAIVINCPLSYTLGWFVPLGIGICNFAACYTCNSRAKLRKKYNLPPSCLCAPYLDDCCTHFWCSYIATHQELREMAIRGADGPGLHILDVLEEDFEGLEGLEAAVTARKQVLERLLLEAPPFAIGGKEAGLDSGAAAAGYTLPKGGAKAMGIPTATATQAPPPVADMERGTASK